MVLVTEPPLYASIASKRRGVTNVNGSLVGPAPSKPMLFVVNCCHGPERYHALVPQSITPEGYCPLRTRLGFARSSNVMVCEAAPTARGRINHASARPIASMKCDCLRRTMPIPPSHRCERRYQALQSAR